MRNTLLGVFASLLIVALISPVNVFAQDHDDEDERNVRIERSEDGNRVVIIEEDGDGDRHRIERRIQIQPRMRGHFRGRSPNVERHGEIVFRGEDGEERSFTFEGDGMNWISDGDGMVSDTTIDGNRVIIIRTPDGNEEIIELDGMSPNSFHFEMSPDMDMEHFNMRDFNFEFPGDGEHEMRFFMDRGEGPHMESFAFGPGMGGMDFMRHLEGMMGASSETRQQMMELERQAAELAAQLRHEENAQQERELDEVLEQLFELRGQARAERADHMEERAEEMRREAEELRESLRERDAERRQLIEERKRELLGRGSGW